MPGDAADKDAILSPEQMARKLSGLAADLGQYLKYQKSLGVSHVGVQDKTGRTLAAWGTPAWKQHRFICQGPENARIMLVDSKGGFFRDKPGRLLVKILSAMHLTPETVCICNAADLHPIRTRVAANPPAVIITLGENACALILGTDRPFSELQGRFHTFSGIKVMPTRHPEELLADPTLKRGVWESMQQVMAAAGLDHGG